MSDHSFKYARLGTKNMDYGHVLENIVAIELIRRGYEIYVGVVGDKEVDFVAMKQGERTYQPEYQHEGIRIIDAAEWLREDKA